MNSKYKWKIQAFENFSIYVRKAYNIRFRDRNRVQSTRVCRKVGRVEPSRVESSRVKSNLQDLTPQTPQIIFFSVDNCKRSTESFNWYKQLKIKRIAFCVFFFVCCRLSPACTMKHFFLESNRKLPRRPFDSEWKPTSRPVFTSLEKLEPTDLLFSTNMLSLKNALARLYSWKYSGNIIETQCQVLPDHRKRRIWITHVFFVFLFLKGVAHLLSFLLGK